MARGERARCRARRGRRGGGGVGTGDTEPPERGVGARPGGSGWLRYRRSVRGCGRVLGEQQEQDTGTTGLEAPVLGHPPPPATPASSAWCRLWPRPFRDITAEVTLGRSLQDNWVPPVTQLGWREHPWGMLRSISTHRTSGATRTPPTLPRALDQPLGGMRMLMGTLISQGDPLPTATVLPMAGAAWPWI